jgi:hypothetical protein
VTSRQVASNGQRYFKKLEVFATNSFDPKASIPVPDFNDPLLATSLLTNALAMSGFKVISHRVVADRLEVHKDTDHTDTGSKQDISVERKIDVKSAYAGKLTYQTRPDTGCGGWVISSLSGHIVNIDNDGEIVATFTFKQGGFGRKCTSDIMIALAQKLRSASVNR